MLKKVFKALVGISVLSVVIISGNIFAEASSKEGNIIVDDKTEMSAEEYFDTWETISEDGGRIDPHFLKASCASCQVLSLFPKRISRCARLFQAASCPAAFPVQCPSFLVPCLVPLLLVQYPLQDFPSLRT